jgi:hypothetical protein
MLELSANDPIIKAYLKDIQRLKEDQLVMHELGLKGPFQNLLDKAAKKRGWTLVLELSTYSGGKRVVPDGTVRDEFRLARRRSPLYRPPNRPGSTRQRRNRPHRQDSAEFQINRRILRFAPIRVHLRLISGPLKRRIRRPGAH